jgi:hypothetical protein
MLPVSENKNVEELGVGLKKEKSRIMLKTPFLGLFQRLSNHDLTLRGFSLPPS